MHDRTTRAIVNCRFGFGFQGFRSCENSLSLDRELLYNQQLCILPSL
jgi:hypothetical protein